MPKIFQLLIMLGISALAGHIARAAASVPTLWKTAPLTFSTETQMKTLMRRNAHDAKQSYYLILRAYNQGLVKNQVVIKKMTLAYYQMHLAAPTDPYLQSAFAFSYYLACDYNFDRWPTRDMELEKYSGAADFGRSISVKKLPNNSAILLMAARSQFFRNAYRSAEVIPEMKQGLTWAKQAIKLERRWAEPYFWVGMMHRFYQGNNVRVTPQQSQTLLRQAIPYYQNCLRLGKGYVEPACWYGLASSYQSLQPRRPRVTLKYLNLYLATLSPQERRINSSAQWRSEIIMEINGKKVTG